MQTQSSGFTSLLHHNPEAPWVISSALSVPVRTGTDAGSILQKWAAGQGYEIIQFQRCFFCGAFTWWTTSRKQLVFSITVRDDAFQERTGWIRFGNFFGGGYTDHEPDVIWTESKDS
jgi:hypothetical protein